MTTAIVSTRQAGLVSCHDCRLLSRLPEMSGHQVARCPRCGSVLHQRKPNSIVRTWALLLAAMVFYLPANLLPMMITTSVGDVQSDTILSGVMHFLHDGSWGIALIIFTASIFIPFVKFIILGYLLISVQLGKVRRPRELTWLYRLTEAVGRWSMVDIFVMTILIALVKLGVFADVEAGPAALYFAAVVVLTMIGAQSFDPRLIWDAVESQHE